MKNVIRGLQKNHCPSCRSEYVVRSHRTLLEKLVSLVGIFPYRCDACGSRFSLWGKNRTRPVEEA
jgi:transposase-like protein